MILNRKPRLMLTWLAAETILTWLRPSSSLDQGQPWIMSTWDAGWPEAASYDERYWKKPKTRTSGWPDLQPIVKNLHGSTLHVAMRCGLCFMILMNDIARNQKSTPHNTWLVEYHQNIAWTCASCCHEVQTHCCMILTKYITRNQKPAHQGDLTCGLSSKILQGPMLYVAMRCSLIALWYWQKILQETLHLHITVI